MSHSSLRFMHGRTFWFCLLLVDLAAMAAAATPPVRVALMDFSTDENSWRQAQAAANFTSLLQIRLANETGVEWIERAQLDVARQELRLSEMELLSGASPIRRGKWAKADWLVTGQFSLDDKNRRTLSVEITDLQHADLLASRTIKLPGMPAAIQPLQDQVELVGLALHDLLAKARHRQEESAGRVIIAPLFVINLSRFGIGRGEEALKQGFYESLERAAATNHNLRIIHFPKAYRAMDESEMVLDGLVEADPQAWQQTADLYVWGTYTLTNSPGTAIRSQLEFTLHMWDGATQPHTFRERLPLSFRDGLQAGVAAGMVDRMVNRVLALARKPAPVADTLSLRREVAESIAQAYRQIGGEAQFSLGVHDDVRLTEEVHMLETACFFDPGNADLHAMRISCRWGWWMDFAFKLENPFWSHWRRSRAWGRYVDQFGSQRTPTPLPFPYQQKDVPEIYIQSLEEVLRMFPQRYDEDEQQQRQRGMHTALMEAQVHGFPKDIPRDVALEWKAEVEAELAERKKQFGQYSRSTSSAAHSHPSPPSNRALPSSAGRLPSSPSKTAPASSTKRAGTPQSPSAKWQPTATPAWLKELRPQSSLFALSAPAVLPAAREPVSGGFSFPPQFNVQTVLQTALCSGKLLILAMDERSAFSSDVNTDLSAERLSQRGRLWSIEVNGQNPTLFEPDWLPANINAFFLENERLWVAGETIGCLDLKTRSFSRFGLHEGLASESIHSLIRAGGSLFAIGDLFKLYQLEPGSPRWQEVKLPTTRLSVSTSTPCLLAGNDRWLAYRAGSPLLYDVGTGTWTNLQDITSVACIAADPAEFWFAGYGGLARYDLERLKLEAWPPPVGIQGLNQASLGPSAYWGQQFVSADAMDRTAEAVKRFLKKLQKDRSQVHQQKANASGAIDPLRLDCHLPRDITALAQDGDFLWIGGGVYSGGSVLLLHKPTRSIVGCFRVGGTVLSLTVSEKEIWIGTGYGKNLLWRIDKQPLLSIPRSQWSSLAISPDERARLIGGMTSRDQAMYAFYAGDDARVAALLASVNPEKATLEEMFLLAFAYDATGLDNLDQARFWFERISSRYPGSPWASAAQEFLAENEPAHKIRQRQALLLAQYDRDHDGILDSAERRAMEKDSAYQQEERAYRDDQLDTQLQVILKKYDRSGDGRLSREELDVLRNSVRVFSEARPDQLAGRKIPVAPLLSRSFPSVDSILRKYGTGRNGTVDAAGLKALAIDIRKNR